MHIKPALRNLSKNKLYSAINIFGLAVGIAACLLIFRLVHYELSFNAHHRNYDRIVRIVTQSSDGISGEGFTPGIPVPAMDAMQGAVSQFEQFARIKEAWPTIAVPDAYGGAPLRKFNTDEEHEIGAFVEPAFFRIFDWQWLAGDPGTALNEPYSVVLNRRTAEKCFDSWEKALGKTLLMDNALLLTVRGVVEDAPDNSDFPFHVMVSYETVRRHARQYYYDVDWGSTSSNNQAFALLRDAGQFAEADAALATVGQKEYAKDSKPGWKKFHRLQKLSDLHYDDRLGTSGSHVISRNRLWVLSLVGLMILAMACFNFINLATALATRRSREVGVRKSLGGSRGQLMGQFMGETTLVVVLAVLLGAGLAFLLAPQLKHISDVPDALPFLGNPAVWVFLAAVTAVVSILSGFYPALILSGFNPVRALKSELSSGSLGNTSLRKSLVVLQFVIAQALIIGTLVTISQLDYIRSMDLGFQPNLVYTVGISHDSVSGPRFEAFKQRLLQLPGVESVSYGSDNPASGNTWSSNFALGRGSEDAPVNTSLKYCDADYFKTYGLRLAAGRVFQPSDTLREVVVNETLLRKLGIHKPEDALGKELRLGGGRWFEVVGVVEDFNSHSLHNELEPITMGSRKRFYNVVGLKIRPEDMSATTASVQQLFDATFPEQVFDGQYYDESIAEFYRDENRFSLTCKGFALLAILISCLGLFGLASLMAVQKTKEIGIRKVLGASVGSVVGLLSRDFLLLVLVAFVVAGPLAWWGMNRWLQDFEYRVGIGWQVFALTGVLALIVAFATISIQAVKAALANPVKSLRSE